MSFTHLAFDIDGTLISSEYANMKALQDTLIKFHGSSPSLEELSPVFGIPGMDALARLGVTDPDVIYPYWAEHVHDYDDTIAPYDGVLELLEELRRRGYSMAVVSSKGRWEYERGFKPMAVAGFFWPAGVGRGHGQAQAGPRTAFEVSGADGRGAGECAVYRRPVGGLEMRPRRGDQVCLCPLGRALRGHP